MRAFSCWNELNPRSGSLAESVTPPLERGANLNELRWGKAVRGDDYDACSSVFVSECVCTVPHLLCLSGLTGWIVNTSQLLCYFYTGHHTKSQHLWQRWDRSMRWHEKTCFYLIYYDFNTLNQLETLHKCLLLFMFLVEIEFISFP